MLETFIAQIKTKEGVTGDTRFFASSAKARKDLAAARDETLADADLGNAVSYRFDAIDLGGGFWFPGASDWLRSDTPIADVRDDWNTELRSDGYWWVEGGFEGSTDIDHATFVAETFGSYVELGLSRWFVEHWQRPDARLSCGLTAAEAAARVAEIPYRRAAHVSVEAIEERPYDPRSVVGALTDDARAELAKALKCEADVASLAARISTGKLPAKRVIKALRLPPVCEPKGALERHFGLDREDEPHVAVTLRATFDERITVSVHDGVRVVDMLAQAGGGEALAQQLDPASRWRIHHKPTTGLYLPVRFTESGGQGYMAEVLVPKALVPTSVAVGAAWDAVAGVDFFPED